MGSLQRVVDRVDIEALRGEFADAGMRRDVERFASLFTEDGHWQIPHANVNLVGRTDIRTAVEHLLGMWEFAVQTTHAGIIEIADDEASGRAYVNEIGRWKDGTSHLNYAVYHDRYRRTPAGWRFTERIYEVFYLDTSPLPGSAPGR
jgi:ketosteroid isomerase-like protein